MDKATQRIIFYIVMILGIALVVSIEGGCRWNSDFRDRERSNTGSNFATEALDPEKLPETPQEQPEFSEVNPGASPEIKPDLLPKKPQPVPPEYPYGLD